MLSLEGRQLGNYDVIKRIRVGGMGAVYEGRQRTAFDRRVAIKVILGNYAKDPDMRRRFAREARTIAQLHHPHILPLIEFGDEHGILYLVMPFIEGGTLTSYLRRNRSLPDISEVAGIYQQLLDAVEYAHDEGLIHRDIKSSNVLLEMRRSGPPYVYLADFGLVRSAQQVDVEHAGKPIPLEHVPGTPHYMAPEQTRGIVTKSTDIYALGVLLYQMLTGELPYDDPDDVKVIQMHLYDPIPSPCECDASIPSELGEVVRRAMAKRPEDRFSTIGELRKAFLESLEASTIPVDEDEAFDDDVFLSPNVHPMNPVNPLRPLSKPLLLPEAPALLPAPTPLPLPLPLPSPRSARATTDNFQRNRQRTTDSVRDRARITGPVGKRRNNRLTLPVVVATAVPLVLLILLLLPRVLNMSIFPVGFPVFGASPDATVSVTAQSKVFQNTYLFTASPQVQSPNSSTRVIPDRLLQSDVSNSRTVSATGNSSTTATRARGTLLYVNSGSLPVFVPSGIIFITTSGIQVQSMQAARVAARSEGKNGAVAVSALAVNTGAIGNIAANALVTTCCGGLFVNNPTPFSGGSDGSVVHILQQSDVDTASNALTSALKQRVLQQFQQQLRNNEVMAGQPVYTTTVLTDSPVGTAVASAQVSVHLTASVAVYNRQTVQQVAEQLLTTQAAQSLGNSYHLQHTITVDTAHIVQQDKNGVISLSVLAHGVWSYYFPPQQLEQWKQTIKGSTPAAAVAYLNSRPGVSAVQIHLPFGTDHLPSLIDNITITLVNS